MEKRKDIYWRFWPEMGRLGEGLPVRGGRSNGQPKIEGERSELDDGAGGVPENAQYCERVEEGEGSWS